MKKMIKEYGTDGSGNILSSDMRETQGNGNREMIPKSRPSLEPRRSPMRAERESNRKRESSGRRESKDAPKF
jgi:hypothetical protein